MSDRLTDEELHRRYAQAAYLLHPAHDAMCMEIRAGLVAAHKMGREESAAEVLELRARVKDLEAKKVGSFSGFGD